MRFVVVSAEMSSQMMDHAAGESPREACGLLVGVAPGHLSRVVATTNIDDRDDRFLIDPEEHHRIVQESEAEGLSIIGVYHSHPKGPRGLSDTDRAAPLDPLWISVIVSPDPQGWRIRAFRLRGGVQRELEVVEAVPVSSLP